MGIVQKRRPSASKSWTREWAPAPDWSQDGNATVLEREDDYRVQRRRPGRVERSSWHDEGVVGDYHTD
jgi:hypothetical protein